MIKLAASIAWIKQRTAEYRITNIEFRRMESFREIFFKIDRIHSFDVRCWTFDAYSPPLEDSMFISFFID